MKYTLPALIALVTIYGAAFGAEPKDTVATFHEALAKNDKTLVLQQLAPEVIIYESGFVERSRDEYAHHHLGEDMAFAKGSTQKVLEQTVRINGNTAVIWEETETMAKIKSTGQPQRIVGTETVLLERRGDAWLIVHIHWSSRKLKTP